MSHTTQAAVERHLDAAERAGAWLVPTARGEVALLRRRCEEGKVVAPLPGCFARSSFVEALGPRRRALAHLKTLARMHPTWIFCFVSAALLHGLDVPPSLLGEVHVLAPTTYRGAGDMVRRHAWPEAELEVVSAQGVRCTSVRRTLLDCLCRTDLARGLPLADSALRSGLVSKAALDAFFRTAGRGMRGIRQARATLALADGRSGGLSESMARAAIVRLGFEVPELQVEVLRPLEPEHPLRATFGWERDEGSLVLGVLEEAPGLGAPAPAAPAPAALAAPPTPPAAVPEVFRVVRARGQSPAHPGLVCARVVRFSSEQVLDGAAFAALLEGAGVPRARP